jgi:HPt (histidine-containing phosphotransfer) domain-containing protein
LTAGLSPDVDADLLPAVEAFTRALPQRVDAMRKSLRSADLDALAQHLHQMKGSGGTFGFMPITSAAAEMEDRLQQGAPLDELARGLEHLAILVETATGISRDANLAWEGQPDRAGDGQMHRQKNTPQQNTPGNIT